MVGAGNADGIHVFLLQDLAEVLLCCGRVAHRLLVSAANLSIVLLSTSQTWVMQALSLFAWSADKWA